MSSTGNVAIILSGCGFKEGSEIHETVLSYLALKEAGFSYESFAPVSVLEAAKPLARDQVSDIKHLQPDKYQALWMPGGGGVAKHLTSFAKDGTRCHVDPDVRRVIEAFYKAKKPIVGICFAPVAIAKVLEGNGLSMTLGTRDEDNAILQALGMKPVSCKADTYIADRQVYTTPAYMEPPHLAGIYHALKGIAAELRRICSR